ncbi:MULTISPECIES: hypothetical protein [Bacillus]|uniref:hypothetical protein n=1 Tax=Bacillus TaxID=1386 RepID=UPI00105F940E|nr:MULTISPECIES: hypothetical protein [Bacillus]KAA0936958.1 hypothetical protein FQ086_05100 [Bacillus sp. ANT_WA51]MCZ8477106.1 hypothetical protein [Bacillus subtilis]WBY35976.1 hypothetical protein PF977_12620 [Bacillus subtilis]WLD63592.1 hypothetical protein PIB33_09765 [Bacillus subtilis]
MMDDKDKEMFASIKEKQKELAKEWDKFCEEPGYRMPDEIQADIIERMFLIHFVDKYLEAKENTEIRRIEYKLWYEVEFGWKHFSFGANDDKTALEYAEEYVNNNNLINYKVEKITNERLFWTEEGVK